MVEKEFSKSSLSYLERQRRRFAFRNEKTFYKRKCDLSGRQIIGVYPSDSIFTVYGQEEFWSDKWNPLNFGRDYDFAKSFFTQFSELMKVVPRLSIINQQSQNSDYCNYSFSNKNCYLTFGSHYEEDCMYGRYSTKNKNCLDYFWLYGSELCYECKFSRNCYQCFVLDHCEQCNDCFFSMDLKGCKNCLFSFGLRNKQYCIFNEQKTEEEYREYLQKLKLKDPKQWQKILAGWNKFKKEKAVFRARYQTNCENCEGTEHQNSKNLKNCFACSDCEDCENGFQMDQTYSSKDCSEMGYDKCELCFNCIGINGGYDLVCCDSCWHCSGVSYCNLCFNSRNCFGCIGLNQKEYCIFNKQYSRDDYEELVTRIIEQMLATVEWGIFFPTEIAPFAYNETVAQEFCPLKKEEVLQFGWKWREDDGEVSDLPGDIYKCEVTGKPFKILKPELDFYQKMGLPFPLRCPDQRMKDRVDLSTFLKTYKRKCAKTGEEIETIYGPDQADIVYSEEVYLREIY